MSACTSERVFHSGHLFWSFLAAISKCGSHLSQKSRISTRSPSTILSLSTPSLSSSDCFLRSNQHKGSTKFAFIWVGAGFDLRQPTSHALSFDTVQLTHKRRPSLSSLQFRPAAAQSRRNASESYRLLSSLRDRSADHRLLHPIQSIAARSGCGSISAPDQSTIGARTLQQTLDRLEQRSWSSHTSTTTTSGSA